MTFLKKVSLPLLACLAIAAIFHGWNMFQYPYYEGDEGIYVSQAWSTLKQGTLSPYVYWYDHPPLGWITMGLWAAIFGGNFFVFGESSIDNMRVLMFIVHLATAALVYFIAKKISNKRRVACFALILFTLSPIFIYYQRRVLLDNLMTLWVVASFALLLVKDLRLRTIALSGALFGLGLLTKIPAIVFLPAMLCTLYAKKNPSTFMRRAALWLTSLFCIGMIFIGFTLVKGEFLPTSLTGGDHGSFIDGIKFQLDRDSAHPFWHPESSFRVAVSDWIFKDSFTVAFMAFGALLSFVAAFKKRSIRIVALFVFFYLLFLIRGGIVTNFYILPLVPFIAIASATSFWWITGRFVRNEDTRNQIYLVVIISVSVITFLSTNKDYFTRDETTNHNESIRWIKENIDEEKAVMMDVQGLVDLWDPSNINEKKFPKADWYSKIIHDNYIQEFKYENNWQNIHYVLSSHELLRQLGSVSGDKIAKQAYVNAGLVKDWSEGAGHIDEKKFESEVGNWAKLYSNDIGSFDVLSESWKAYKESYIQSYGQTVDAENQTTSESQSYALLRAVWMNDRDTFDGVLQWSEDHFQFRAQDKLFSSVHKEGNLLEEVNNSLADANIAAALIFAHKTWGDEKYQTLAKKIIGDLWDQSVVTIAGRNYMLPMEVSYAVREDGYLYSPAHATPVWYRLFVEYDNNPWQRLASDTYKTLEDIAAMPNNKTGLPSDWMWIQGETGTLGQKDGDLTKEVDPFGYSAFRVLWFTALDVSLFGDERAKKYLTKINAFIVPNFESRGELPAIIHPSGKVVAKENNVTVNVGYLAALMVHGDESVSKFYEKFFADTYGKNGRYWGDVDDIYSASWAWFGVALYNEKIKEILK